MLPLDSFNRLGAGRQHWCRDCFRHYFRERGDKHRIQSEAARLKRRKASYLLVAEYLAGAKCSICGIDDPAVLEFDHIQSKQANVSQLAYESFAPRRVAEEIALCQVLCVNCHRRITQERARSWRHSDLDLASKHLTKGQRRNLLWMRDVLARSRCADCGLTDLRILEFDHVGPKTGNVTRLARNGVSLQRLEAEVAACEIVCANCHRIRTRRRKRELWAHPDEPGDGP